MADLSHENISPFFYELLKGGGGTSEETRQALDALWARVNKISTSDGVLKLGGTPSDTPGAIWIEGLEVEESEIVSYAGVYPTIEEEIAALWERLNLLSNEEGVILLGTKPSDEIGAIWIEDNSNVN